VGVPSARTARAFAEAGVRLVASTDSHDCRDVGSTPRSGALPAARSPARRRDDRVPAGLRVAARGVRADRRRPAAGRQLPVPAGGAALPAAALRRVRARVPAHGDPDPGLERACGHRGVDRPPHEARIPAPGAADLRRGRRQHRRYPAGDPGQGRRVPGKRVSTCAGRKRRGQGRDPQSRPGHHPRRRLDAGRPDHGCGRHLRARFPAQDEQAPRRSEDRLGHGLHQGGQPARELHDQVHRPTSTSPPRPPPAAARRCSA